MPTNDVLDLKRKNSELLREDVAAKRSLYRGLPEVVSLYTTDICNLKCIMCPRAESQGSEKMPIEALERVAETLFPTAWKVLVTAGAGEPLLAHFDLIREKVLEHQVRLDLITNATLTTADWYRKTRPALDHLNLSLDCHVPEVYESIRPGLGFERVDRNLRTIAKIRREEPDDVLMSISSVVMRRNLPHLPDFVRYAAEVGVDGVILQRLQHTVKGSPEEDPFTDPGEDEVRRILELTKQAARDAGINVLAGELGDSGAMVKPIRNKVPVPMEGPDLCWFLAQNFGVIYTGDVYPCCMPTEYKLGNVLEDDPRDIRNSSVARELREGHFTRAHVPYCSGCMHAPHLGPAEHAQAPRDV